MKKISVITPSCRPDMLAVVSKCLSRQTLTDFEWIVSMPINQVTNPIAGVHIPNGRLIWDPPRKAEDYYSLNKAWNVAFQHAQGELIISIQDGLWFPPDLLEKFWQHYQDNPKALVSAIGHQYDQIEHGKPEHRVWTDPRQRTDCGSFYEVAPTELEFCIASVPKAALFAVGGIDEEFDKYAALSEKELCFRMEALGYTFWLDQSMEYRAIKHPRLSEQWEERFQKGCVYYNECLTAIAAGKRCKLDFLH